MGFDEFFDKAVGAASRDAMDDRWGDCYTTRAKSGDGTIRDDDEPDPNTQDVGNGDCVADDICSTWYTFGHRGGAFTLKPGDLDPCPPETSITYTLDDQPAGYFSIDTGEQVDPPNECAECGVRYWRTQGIDDYCGPCSGGAGNLRDGSTYTFNGYTVVVAPKPLDHNPRDQTRRIAEKLQALERDVAMRESCPPRKVFLCDHCDRHHEGELQSVNVKLGAQYAVTCEATGLDSMRWIPAEELWG